MRPEETIEELAKSKCVPCSTGTPPLAGAALAEISGKLGHGWRVMDGHHLEKEFAFRNFKEALDFTNRVGALAEEQNHHPDIYLAWGKVKITLWTHKINGLSESDFKLAAQIESLNKS